MAKQIASDSVRALKRVSDDETLREATPDEVRASDEAADGLINVPELGWCYVQVQGGPAHRRHMMRRRRHAP